MVAEAAEPLCDGTADHLIVVIHGMWGSTFDVDYLANVLGRDVPQSIVLMSKVSSCSISTTLLCAVDAHIYYY